MLDGLRRMVERVLPWYDPRGQVERDRRKAAVARRAELLTQRIRDDYRYQDDRLAGRR